ncbi:hypothetical protein RHMOL_Rhmol09G0134900 [Rhododendron molle]|uniref:Uncharacterized protein n=1 Tax=Rhododendron molle TaxID=49168 RepID=A0ACC0MCU1_RHOML|nr:hypothetical protein RHMOL_Rhmol09G0134900 [Rhododendron molle]
MWWWVRSVVVVKLKMSKRCGGGGRGESGGGPGERGGYGGRRGVGCRCGGGYGGWLVVGGCSFVTDGAWLAASNIGAAAWVLESSDGDPPYQCVLCKALSDSFVEIRAALMVLHWAFEQQMDSICIKLIVQCLSRGF